MFVIYESWRKFWLRRTLHVLPLSELLVDQVSSKLSIQYYRQIHLSSLSLFKSQPEPNFCVSEDEGSIIPKCRKKLVLYGVQTHKIIVEQNPSW